MTIKPSDTIKVNGLSLVGVGTVNNAIVINGIPCEESNAYRVGSKGYYYIAYPGDRITDGSTSYQHMTIAPFLNVGGEQLENSDFYYSATLNFKDFYDKFTSETLSTYSSLFNQLNIDYGKSEVKIQTGILGRDSVTCFKSFELPIATDSEYAVTVSYAPPPHSVKVYKYIDSSGRFATVAKQRPTVKILRKKINISAGYYMKLTDVNFRITIMKIYENV